MTNNDAPPDRYGLVGHPVEHSRSPFIHTLFARQTGQRLTYELIDASPAAFETACKVRVERLASPPEPPISLFPVLTNIEETPDANAPVRDTS